MWLIPLCASPIGVLLWIIDVRTRHLYHAAIQAGKTLEGSQKGFYTILADEVILPPHSSPFRKLTQSAALNVAFLGSSLLLLIISLLLSRLPANPTANALQSPPAVKVTVTATTSSNSK